MPEESTENPLGSLEIAAYVAVDILFKDGYATISSANPSCFDRSIATIVATLATQIITFLLSLHYLYPHLKKFSPLKGDKNDDATNAFIVSLFLVQTAIFYAILRYLSHWPTRSQYKENLLSIDVNKLERDALNLALTPQAMASMQVLFDHINLQLAENSSASQSKKDAFIIMYLYDYLAWISNTRTRNRPTFAGKTLKFLKLVFKANADYRSSPSPHTLQTLEESIDLIKREFLHLSIFTNGGIYQTIPLHSVIKKGDFTDQPPRNLDPTNTYGILLAANPLACYLLRNLVEKGYLDKTNPLRAVENIKCQLYDLCIFKKINIEVATDNQLAAKATIHSANFTGSIATLADCIETLHSTLIESLNQESSQDNASTSQTAIAALLEIVDKHLGIQLKPKLFPEEPTAKLDPSDEESTAELDPSDEESTAELDPSILVIKLFSKLCLELASVKNTTRKQPTGPSPTLFCCPTRTATANLGQANPGQEGCQQNTQPDGQADRQDEIRLTVRTTPVAATLHQ